MDLMAAAAPSGRFESDLDAKPLDGAHADRAGAAPAALGSATAAKLSRELLSDGQFVVLAEPVELGDQLFALAISVREGLARTLP